jgi:hypothetical protein
MRFSSSMWRQLTAAAAWVDVSVAQYVREAARMRLEADAHSDELEQVRQDALRAQDASLAEAESSAALWEQGRLARERARMLRQQTREQREYRGAGSAAPRVVPQGPSPVWTEGALARERSQLGED